MELTGSGYRSPWQVVWLIPGLDSCECGVLLERISPVPPITLSSPSLLEIMDRNDIPSLLRQRDPLPNISSTTHFLPGIMALFKAQLSGAEIRGRLGIMGGMVEQAEHFHSLLDSHPAIFSRLLIGIP